jgi:hypothetical protein
VEEEFVFCETEIEMAIIFRGIWVFKRLYIRYGFLALQPTVVVFSQPGSGL